MTDALCWRVSWASGVGVGVVVVAAVSNLSSASQISASIGCRSRSRARAWLCVARRATGERTLAAASRPGAVARKRISGCVRCLLTVDRQTEAVTEVRKQRRTRFLDR